MFRNKPATGYDIDKLERQISALESKIYSLSLEINQTKREVESFSSKFKNWLCQKELNSGNNWLIWSIAILFVALMLNLISDKHQDNKAQLNQPSTMIKQEGAVK